ncbi:hypothetical protein Pla163_15220 [Planctomycetes bacterium Pla163]|uniref:Roadblock/LAMTOR2 domain-containing protein n=1 Tax=Rohdeia mirabilis TaxID=2528008 RepID=A0A518CYV4_9BACT|nr:hypothetical protein Pla163_15220 [Planctomycetes bacterium Pla163]
MQELEPLSRLFGVRFVALVTEDGVPIPVGEQSLTHDADRLAAVSQQFLSELVQATGPLTWGPPTWSRIASDRGGLALLRVRGGALLVIYGNEADPSTFKLPMQAAALRVTKSLERLGAGASELEKTAPALPRVDQVDAPSSDEHGSVSSDRVAADEHQNPSSTR